MLHDQASPLAGRSVRVLQGSYAGQEILVEDWWDRIGGRSWMNCDGNPACLIYAMRERTPLDDEVIYGKIGWEGVLVHVSFLAADAGT